MQTLQSETVQEKALHMTHSFWNDIFIRRFRLLIPGLILCFFLLSGCAGNVINLSYPPMQQDIPSTAKKGITVCVVDFENKRPAYPIGERQDGSPILPRVPVERWLATGVAEELKRGGYTVLMAETLPDALDKGSDYIITGEADEVWLAETSLTRYTGTIRASITLLDGAGSHITKNGYNSVYSKGILPVYGVPQTLLNDALAEMLQPAARLLFKTMQ